MRNAKPKDVLLTRLENRAGGGFPDVWMNWKGLSVLVELKASKGKIGAKLNISPHQIAFHTRLHRSGGLSVFLAKHHPTKEIALISGAYALQLSQGKVPRSEQQVFLDIKSAITGLKLCMLAHHDRVSAILDAGPRFEV